MIRKLCNAADLPPEGKLKAFVDQLAEEPLALCVGVVGGRAYAIDNACPHQRAPLAAGKLDGLFVVCPLHSWKWNLLSGRAAHPSDPDLSSYEVRQYGHEVFVRISPRAERDQSSGQKAEELQTPACADSPPSAIRQR